MDDETTILCLYFKIIVNTLVKIFCGSKTSMDQSTNIAMFSYITLLSIEHIPTSSPMFTCTCIS